MLAWQVGARLTFPNNFYVQLAPTLYNYTGNGDTFNIHYVGGNPALSNSASLATNQTGINSLLVFDIPVEVGWKPGDCRCASSVSSLTNFEGDDRAQRPAVLGGFDAHTASITLGCSVSAIGQLKAKNDWEIRVWWQHSRSICAGSQPG